MVLGLGIGTLDARHSAGVVKPARTSVHDAPVDDRAHDQHVANGSRRERRPPPGTITGS
jgi:hypothetical protein